PEKPATLGQASSAIADERAQLDQGWSIVRPFLKQPRWLAVLLVCLFAAPLIAYVIEQLGHSGAAASLGGLATLFTVFAGAAGTAARWVNQRLDRLAAAQRRVADEEDKQANEHQRQVDAAQQAVDEVTAQLAAAQREHARLTDRLDEITRDLDKKPEEVL